MTVEPPAPVSELKTRVAEARDMATVSALLARSYPVLMAPGYDPAILAAALPLMTTANPALLSSETFYLAEVGSAAVGCGGWTLERPGAPADPIDPGLGHIRHFATDPAHLRRGVGAALFARCVAEASARGVSRFECYSSLVAEPFYASLGFEIVERMEVRMGPEISFPSVRMRVGISAVGG